MPPASPKKHPSPHDQEVPLSFRSKLDDSDTKVPFWGTLARFVSPYRRKLVISACLAIIVGALIAGQTLIVKWIIDNGALRAGAGGELAPVADRAKWVAFYIGIYVVLFGSRVTIGVTGVHLLIDSVEGLLADLRARFFRHVQALCLRFHEDVSSGELFNYIMGSPLNSLKMFLHQALLVAPIQAVSWIVVLSTLATFDLLLTGVTALVVVATVLINMRSKRLVREVSTEFMAVESSSSKHIADLLRGSRAIKMYAIEQRVNVSFENLVFRMRDLGKSVALRQFHERVKVETLNYVGLAIVFSVGCWQILNETLTVGSFFAFITSYNLLMGNLAGLMELNLVRGNAEAGLERIGRILDLTASTPEPAGEWREEVPDTTRADAPARPIVEFDQVTFSYDNKRPVLSDITVSVAAGQSVALVGPSGSGKSTFVKLLQRLYDVTDGRILFKGGDIRRFSQQQYRSHFGVVPQEPYLFQASIIDNVRVLRPDASPRELRDAMRRAHVLEFLDEMPDREHTQVGENGAALSGGQRQRIAIARVLLGDPEIFIFDEATSALDNRSELLVQRAMEEMTKDRTCFIIAHRLSTIRHVDRVLVFENGRIVQDGGYEELAATPGLFRDLLEGKVE